MAKGGTDYQWFPPIGLDNPAIPNPIVTPELTTIYKVMVSSGNCKDSAFVTIGVKQAPIANAGPDLEICNADTVSIGASPIIGNTYLWEPATGLSESNKAQTLASPPFTTRYILTVTNSFGCNVQDTALIIVKPKEQSIFTLKPTVITVSPEQEFLVTLNIPGGVDE